MLTSALPSTEEAAPCAGEGLQPGAGLKQDGVGVPVGWQSAPAASTRVARHAGVPVRSLFRAWRPAYAAAAAAAPTCPQSCASGSWSRGQMHASCCLTHVPTRRCSECRRRQQRRQRARAVMCYLQRVRQAVPKVMFISRRGPGAHSAWRRCFHNRTVLSMCCRGPRLGDGILCHAVGAGTWGAVLT